MASFRKSYACFIIALSLLIVLAGFAQQIKSNYAAEVRMGANIPSKVNEIFLEANKPDAFNWYNTNGTLPYMNGSSALFCGSNRTNVYSDMVSFTTIKAEKSLVLEAEISVNINNFSNSAEDQFAVFATDDTKKYKSNEFGFVLPETANVWYAYVQSPQIAGFFIWKPLLTIELNRIEQYSFKAVYSNDGLNRFVDFYVDGKILWRTAYPNISSHDFHMVLTSHKVSAENIDISQNKMEIENAIFSDRSESGSQDFAYPNLVLLMGIPIFPVLGKGNGAS